MNMFTIGVSELIKMKCKSVILIKEMDISKLMTYDEQVKSEKLQKIRMRESKSARIHGLS